MSKGIETIVYPVRDVAKAKAVFSAFLGVEPYADQPYYVGYRLGELEIGLDPRGHSNGSTGPIAYREVTDIKANLQLLLDAGAETLQGVKDVGGGMLIATVKDADGNILGLRQSAS